MRRLINEMHNLWIFCGLILVFLAMFLNGTPILLPSLLLMVISYRMLLERNLVLMLVSLSLVAIFAIRIWSVHQVQQNNLAEEVIQNSWLSVDPSQLKIDGDSLSGYGKLTLQEKAPSEEVAFFYRIKSEEEKYFFQEENHVISLKIEGLVLKPEHERNPYGFDYADYLKSRGIFKQVQIERISDYKRNNDWVSQFIFFKNRHISKIKSSQQGLIRDYSLGLILGIRSYVDPERLEDYKVLGIMHVLAISGLHIAILSDWMIRLMWRVGITREKTYLLVPLILIAYGFLLSWPVGASRAILTTILTLITKKIKWLRLSTVDVYAFILVLALLVQPYSLLSAGFCLSYGLTAAIILCSKAIKGRSLSSKMEGLFLSVLVFLFAVPLLSMNFYQWNWLSILLSIVLSWLLKKLIIPCLFSYCLSIWLSISFVSQILFALINPILTILENFVAYLSKMTWTTWITGHGNVLEWSVYMVILIALVMKLESNNANIKKLAGLSLSLILCLVLVKYQGNSQVIMVDVGQGDATLFQQKGFNQAVLIDTGGQVTFDYSQKAAWKTNLTRASHASKTLIPALKAQGISSLRYLVLTHADADHIGNLSDLLQSIPTDYLVMSKGMEEHPIMLEIFQQLDVLKSKPKLILIDQPSHFTLIDLSLTFIPPKNISRGSNEDSLVTIVEEKGISWLVAGDIDCARENQLLADYPHLKIDVLKLAHHGSQTSSCQDWLESLAPQVALISLGKNNRYGHPHPSVVMRLEELAIPYFRTDSDGAVIMEVKNGQIEIKTTLKDEE
ncbi:DNA internalization-related competence protein ComEC/Rec2 [Granulicatella seriolae]|uniref:DNA internalization-related competence protein ComEC/Rec2 n=1 Tax=Granulicatella seriolae TaxID=2967226 RepID=A0ABT1WMY1_9LACT|nr:DNA internalization-related competence protein ComEC/Rec2 [Granulicatella seriolae]